MADRLSGATVLVVGAGTRPSPVPDPPLGNGRAISVACAEEGATVVCADVDGEAAEATAALVRAGRGPRPWWWRPTSPTRRAAPAWSRPLRA